MTYLPITIRLLGYYYTETERSVAPHQPPSPQAAMPAPMASGVLLLLTPKSKSLSSGSVRPPFPSTRLPLPSYLSFSTPHRSISLNALSLATLPLPLPLPELPSTLIHLFQASPPTWKSAFATNLIVFLLGSPILATGLSIPGIGAAFLLGTLTWRAFGSSGFLLVASYFLLVSSILHLLLVV